MENMTAGKKITILMLQYSVVVKGIERKLADLGCVVNTVSENLENEVQQLHKQTDLFLFYLPGDLWDDSAKKKRFQLLCELIRSKRKKMILVGESKYHEEALRENSQLSDYEWMNRPVDMKQLEQTVEGVLAKKEDSGRKKRILIIDDDPSFAKMIREWIRGVYRVDIVTGGMQAITFLAKLPAEEKVDLILLDYEMPVVDGPQVLQMLRQDESTSRIPVIFLTGIGTKEAVMRVMSLKPAGYLLKSTPRTDILEFLQEKLK